MKNNRQGIIGWIYGGKYNIERYLYTLHRITGLGLVLYMFLHFFVTALRINKTKWEWIMGIFDSPFFHFMEWVVFAAAIFHGLNGLRLILSEFGIIMGKPGRPVYPYKSVFHKQRIFTIIIMIIAFIFIVFGFYDFLIKK